MKDKTDFDTLEDTANTSHALHVLMDIFQIQVRIRNMKHFLFMHYAVPQYLYLCFIPHLAMLETKQPSHQSNFFIIIIKLNTNQPFVCCGPNFFRSKQLNIFAIFIRMMIASISFPTKMATFLNICGLTLNFGQIRRLYIGPIKEQFLSVNISHL